MFGNKKIIKKFFAYEIEKIALTFGILGLTSFLIENFRKEIPHIQIFQLSPAIFYFLLSTSSVFFLIIFQKTFVFAQTFDFETKKGCENGQNLRFFTLSKTNVSFFLEFFFDGIFLLIPLSLNSFNSSTQGLWSANWSYYKARKIALSLNINFFVFCQLSCILFFCFQELGNLHHFPKIWKLAIFTSMLLGGFLTPTVEIIIQTVFGVLCFIFYLKWVDFLQVSQKQKYKMRALLA